MPCSFSKPCRSTCSYARTAGQVVADVAQGVGGCNDGPGIMTLKKEGKLDGMLQKAPGGCEDFQQPRACARRTRGAAGGA